MQSCNSPFLIFVHNIKVSAIPAGNIYSNHKSEFLQNIGYNCKAVFIELSYSSCFVGYIFIVRQAHKSPVCTIGIKNQPEIIINIFTQITGFHKQYMMLHSFTYDNIFSVKGNKHQKGFFVSYGFVYSLIVRVF